MVKVAEPRYRIVNSHHQTAMPSTRILTTLLIGLLIRLDSPGSVFFTQIRVGKGERLFACYKFRSMRAGAEQAVHHILAVAGRGSGGEVAEFPSTGTKRG